MDAEEFKEIYLEYGNLVWSMIGKLGIPVSDRDDVFVESWDAISRSFDSFDGRSKLSTWIALVVRNKAIDHIRRRHPIPIEADELLRRIEAFGSGIAICPVVPRRDPSPLDKVVWKEIAELIRRGLEKLPPQRKFIVEKWMIGCKYREIAELLNAAEDDPVDVNYVGKEIYNAKLEIRKYLAGEGIQSIRDLLE